MFNEYCTKTNIIIFTVLFIYPTLAVGFSKSGTAYTTDGSQADVEAAHADAMPGDTILIPAGTFTWGRGGDPVVLGDKTRPMGMATDCFTSTVTMVKVPPCGTSLSSGQQVNLGRVMR